MWSFVCLTVSVVTQTLRGGMNAIDVILHVLTMPAVAAEVHFHYISSFCVFCLSCADSEVLWLLGHVACTDIAYCQ